MKNPYFRVALFSLLLVGTIALGGGIKTWASGDTISISDINSNFQHLHNNMVGGHGARLVNADVSSTANIGYTKIQNGRGIARAWGRVGTDCTSSPCTVDESMNVTSVTRDSTGVYEVNLSYTATDAVYATIAVSENQACFCIAEPDTTTKFDINCYDRLDVTTAPTVLDCQFNFVVYDAD